MPAITCPHCGMLLEEQHVATGTCFLCGQSLLAEFRAYDDEVAALAAAGPPALPGATPPPIPPQVPSLTNPTAARNARRAAFPFPQPDQPSPARGGRFWAKILIPLILLDVGLLSANVIRNVNRPAPPVPQATAAEIAKANPVQPQDGPVVKGREPAAPPQFRPAGRPNRFAVDPNDPQVPEQNPNLNRPNDDDEFQQAFQAQRERALQLRQQLIREALERQQQAQRQQEEMRRRFQEQANQALNEQINPQRAGAETKITAHTIQIQSHGGSLSVGNINGDRIATIAGVCSTMNVNIITDQAQCDATGCEARSVILNELSGSAKAQFHTMESGTFLLMRLITGESELHVESPTGTVICGAMNDPAKGTINGNPKIFITAKRVVFNGEISGQAKIELTLTKGGSLKFQQLAGSAKISYKKQDAADPELKITQGNIVGDAKLECLDR